MTQGRDYSCGHDGAGTLFDLYKERLALLGEPIPPSGHLDPESRGPRSTGEPPGAVDDPLTSEFDPAPASLTHPESDLGDSVEHSRPFAPSAPGLSVSSGGLGLIGPGDLIFDHYVVERKLGEGGMGSVWLVRHVEFDSERALKLIVSGIATDPQVRARFRREARIMDRLDHPNAVRVYDARMGEDVAFIVMEYLRGRSLNQLLVPGVAMPLDWVADLLEQLCDVLQAANDAGIIHRDVKPSNLMLVDGRRPGTKVLKLLDFGIAKIRETGADDVRTLTGSFLGTPLYSSPEQIAGHELDSRSDLYAVGLILYELLTGRRPFGGSMNSVIYQQVAVAPPSFAEVNPEVSLPPGVEPVVMACLAKEPDDRPGSPRDLAEMFRRALDSGPWPAGPTPPCADPRTQGYESDLGGLPGESWAGVRVPSRPGEPRKPSLRESSAGLDEDVGVAVDDRESPASRRSSPWMVALGVLAILVGLAVLGLFTRPSGARVTPGPGKPAASPDPRVGKQAKLWARQGFRADEAAGRTGGWPNILVGAGGHARFRRTPGGIYLPEGYTPGAELAEDGYPRTLTRVDDGATFLRIVEGPFTMGGVAGGADVADAGRGRPSQPVRLPGFYMQATEVTNGEILRHLDELGGPDACKEWVKRFGRVKVYLGDDVEAASRHPAGDISWHVASRYAAMRGGRLPAEVQWEFAARSRGMAILHVWDFRKGLTVPATSRANLNTLADSNEGTTAFGRYPTDRTFQGVDDLTGNVREWCRDVFRPSPSPDPEDAADGTAGAEEKRVVRGGSFMTSPEFGETTNRDEPHHPDDVADDIGFRIVIECPEALRDVH